MCIESHDTHVNSTVFTIQTLRGGCMHGDTPAKLFRCEFPLCVYDMDRSPIQYQGRRHQCAEVQFNEIKGNYGTYCSSISLISKTKNWLSLFLSFYWLFCNSIFKFC